MYHEKDKVNKKSETMLTFLNQSRDESVLKVMFFIFRDDSKRERKDSVGRHYTRLGFNSFSDAFMDDSNDDL